MSKTEVENVIKLKASRLYKYKYFTGRRTGELHWYHGWSQDKSKVGIEVVTMGDEYYVRIQYTQTSRRTGEKKEFDYKISLTTTSCYFGGFRYWFKCPISNDGIPCGRRVGVLYKDGDYFGCRHCHNLTYESRNLSGFLKSLGKQMSDDELDDIRYDIKRIKYKGKYTKRYLRYLRLCKQNEESSFRFFTLSDEKLKELGDAENN
ncbi:MAG: hypothetical protein KBC11_02655 [Candidatus Pacebacteria bacterium]|nr:hypothetical protein [Candidatus Paceibacterota bacterium]